MSVVFLFSSADINLGLIRYVLHHENIQETMDTFKFSVKDSKPNVVSDNVFHIQWSLISFEHKRSVHTQTLRGIHVLLAWSVSRIRSVCF